MSLRSKVEAIIYAAEDPVSVEQMAAALKDSLGEEAGDPKAAVRAAVEELIADYAAAERGMEIRLVAGGYRMSTKPEFHDVVRAFAKSLKPPVRLSLPALETLSVIAYKQPVTLPEISEIRSADSSAVIATLLDRKLITTAGRKAVIGRPILYRTTREFLLRFGLRDMSELPTLQEYEELAGQSELFPAAEAIPDATGVPDEKPADEGASESENLSAANSSD
jgi:segregation and condensation protein B